MRKMLEYRSRIIKGGIMLALALALFGRVFFAETIVSRAESKGKISAASVNIRQEPSTSSKAIGSTQRDKEVSIISQVKGADGYTWYKVYVSADTLGYIRSDLVTITDGTTPPSEGGTATPPPSNEPPATDEPPAEPPEVTDVNPVSGTVTGDSVKILDNIFTSANEVAVVVNATALTITGQATDADGNIWYRVSFISDEAQVAGYVQSVYVHPSADLTPVTPDQPPQTEPTPTPVPQKQYETIYANGEWKLYNIDDPNTGYSIEALLTANSGNQKLYEDAQKSVKSQKIVIIILVFLLVAAVAGIAFLVFKVRDMMDSAYFNEVENETLRRRSAAGGQGGPKVMHSVGAEKQEGRASGTRQPASGTQGPRPGGTSSGQRPAGASQSRKPAGAAPSGAQGQRPAGASQGQKPGGTSASGAQGQRPAGGSAAGAQGQRPAGGSASGAQGQRPAGGSAAGAQGQRPAGGVSQSRRPAGAASSGAQGQRPAGVPQGAKPVQSGAQKAQPKNFMEDDEEFEFEFLNYDGDDEK